MSCLSYSFEFKNQVLNTLFRYLYLFRWSHSQSVKRMTQIWYNKSVQLMFLSVGIRPLGTKYGPFSVKRPKRLEHPGPPLSHSNSGADFPSWLLSYIRLINHFNSKWLKNPKNCHKLIYHSGQKLNVFTIFDTFLEDRKWFLD